MYKCLMNIYLEISMITNSSDMYRTRNANNFVSLLLVDLWALAPLPESGYARLCHQSGFLANFALACSQNKIS